MANFIKKKWIVFKSSETCQHNSKVLRIPNLCLFIYLALVVVELLVMM